MIARLFSIPFVLAGAALPAGAASSEPTEQSMRFQRDTTSAMTKMDAAMMATPTGNVDSDFVQMMEPHHQGAIDMAVAEIRYGHNEQLKRIAQEIIVDQQQEISAMRLALGRSLPSSYPAPTQQPLNTANHATMHAEQEK